MVEWPPLIRVKEIDPVDIAKYTSPITLIEFLRWLDMSCRSLDEFLERQIVGIPNEFVDKNYIEQKEPPRSGRSVLELLKEEDEILHSIEEPSPDERVMDHVKWFYIFTPRKYYRKIARYYSPTETIQRGRGSCISKTVLGIALIRDRGIPARPKWGICTDDDRKGHMWLEVNYAGFWTPLDVTNLGINDLSLRFTPECEKRFYNVRSIEN